MQSDLEDLNLHPFTRKVMENIQPLLKLGADNIKKSAKKGKIQSKEKAELLEHQWYDYIVFFHLSSLLSGIERLQQTQNFIGSFPQPRKYQKKGINQYTWLEYHYSYYLATIVSLFDIALILTNSVFRLGNRDRDCKPDLIMNNSWVTQTPVKKTLSDLDQLVKPHREGRNLHLHRGQMPDIASKMKLEELDLLKIYSLVQMREPFIEQEFIDWGFKSATKEISQKLLEERHNVNNLIWRLLNDLYPIYDVKSTELHQKWNGIILKAVEDELKRRGIKH